MGLEDLTALRLLVVRQQEQVQDLDLDRSVALVQEWQSKFLEVKNENCRHLR